MFVFQIAHKIRNIQYSWATFVHLITYHLRMSHCFIIYLQKSKKINLQKTLQNIIIKEYVNSQSILMFRVYISIKNHIAYRIPTMLQCNQMSIELPYFSQSLFRGQPDGKMLTEMQVTQYLFTIAHAHTQCIRYHIFYLYYKYYTKQC